ncbi:class I SAM-dependent methyltransferase [Methyloversatilis sp.]|uniref:class I SAM-dependent methyltransferase n=1 Tax=Methyloversatilis sp. TaxID=2569862 RepID=UPI00273357DB|nr:class I SAM-dependent methyltransferase [Methyloversatilis sp.]MDP2870329.1 class I SAM-dependent methyltransferase [Methyloversatilis sp.]MDP3454406.1 class I SAM-dependent methyltransferase [Methyloversatilis sp.]MDP3577897.1 class I SAM-dependent methyltransferase [Methyloversatilis sp.]
MTDSRLVFTEGDAEKSLRWQSEAGLPPPKRVVVADDTLSADSAFRLASEGTALLWRSDFQNARQLLQALVRRVDRKPRKPAATMRDAFNQHRLAQSQRARTLGMLLIPFDAGHVIPLRRAPDVVEACTQAHGEARDGYVCSLRELLGVISAYEWRRNGVEVPALEARIHPHYGVFSPVRGEYVDLVAKAPLPAVLKKASRAFDIGTGTGVLAALLAKRGVAKVVATDQDERALACARDNVTRLGLGAQIDVRAADLFPDGRAPLIVCNPPWLPARPASPLEHAVYDPDSRMLRGFLSGLAEHLGPDGEGWLILSDFAEHLGLRTADELQGWIDDAGLEVLGHLDARPRHPKASDESDPLHEARSQEVTRLWRLGAKEGG